jgi:hypothetical protein
MRVFGRRIVRGASGFIVKIVAVTKAGVVAMSSRFLVNGTDVEPNERRPEVSSSTAINAESRNVKGDERWLGHTSDVTTSPTPCMCTTVLSWQATFGIASAVGLTCGVLFVAVGLIVLNIFRKRRHSSAAPAHQHGMHLDTLV